MRKQYDSYIYQLELDYSGSLGEEETRSGEVCPACKGGSSQEGSLSVTRRGGVLLWKCHRASCSFGGSVNLLGAVGNRDKSSNPKSGSRGLYVPTQPIDQATAKFLAARFGIPTKSCGLAGLRWTGEGDGKYARRISFPIYGPDLKERGASYRSYQGANPKNVIVLRDEDSISAAWYRWKRTSANLIIVEDQMSAIKMAPYLDSLALLGTNLSEAKVNEILEQKKYKHIYLCLDNDATMEAVRTQLKWRHKLPNMCIQGLGTDIKDMNDEEFTAFLAAVAPNQEPGTNQSADQDH